MDHQRLNNDDKGNDRKRLAETGGGEAVADGIVLDTHGQEEEEEEDLDDDDMRQNIGEMATFCLYGGNIAAACRAANLEAAEAKKDDSEESVEKRRQKATNRLTSWQSRERKRIEAEVLQERQAHLATENDRLKDENEQLRKAVEIMKRLGATSANQLDPNLPTGQYPWLYPQPMTERDQYTSAPSFNDMITDPSSILNISTSNAGHVSQEGQAPQPFLMPSNLPFGSLLLPPTGGETAANGAANNTLLRDIDEMGDTGADFLRGWIGGDNIAGLSGLAFPSGINGISGLANLPGPYQFANPSDQSKQPPQPHAKPNINDAIARYGTPYIRTMSAPKRSMKKSTTENDDTDSNEGAKKPRSRK